MSGKKFIKGKQGEEYKKLDFCLADNSEAIDDAVKSRASSKKETSDIFGKLQEGITEEKWGGLEEVVDDKELWGEIPQTNLLSTLETDLKYCYPNGIVINKQTIQINQIFEGERISSDHMTITQLRDMVADALVKAIRKVNQIIFDRWDVERVAQVVGYDGAKYWIKYTGVENRGEYNIRVDVESMVPSTKRMKKREIVELIQALGKNPRANIDYLMKLLLREYEWIDAMQVLPDAPETMEQPMGQQQFLGMQNKMLQNPQQLQERAGKNAEMIGRFF